MGTETVGHCSQYHDARMASLARSCRKSREHLSRGGSQQSRQTFRHVEKMILRRVTTLPIPAPLTERNQNLVGTARSRVLQAQRIRACCTRVSLRTAYSNIRRQNAGLKRQ